MNATEAANAIRDRMVPAASINASPTRDPLATRATGDPLAASATDGEGQRCREGDRDRAIRRQAAFVVGGVGRDRGATRCADRGADHGALRVLAEHLAGDRADRGTRRDLARLLSGALRADRLD